AKAKERLAQIEREYHVPTVIETVDSLQGATLEAETTQRARKSGAEGIFILIPKREAKIDAIRAARVADVVEPARLHAIRDAFIAAFKNRDFDSGLTGGVDVIEKTLAQAKAEGKAVAAPASGLIVRNQVKLTLDGARKILAGAEAKAKELNLK